MMFSHRSAGLYAWHVKSYSAGMIDSPALTLKGLKGRLLARSN